MTIFSTPQEAFLQRGPGVNPYISPPLPLGKIPCEPKLGSPLPPRGRQRLPGMQRRPRTSPYSPQGSIRGRRPRNASMQTQLVSASPANAVTNIPRSNADPSDQNTRSNFEGQETKNFRGQFANRSTRHCEEQTNALWTPPDSPPTPHEKPYMSDCEKSADLHWKNTYQDFDYWIFYRLEELKRRLRAIERRKEQFNALGYS